MPSSRYSVKDERSFFKEHSLYPCGSFALHVREHVSISVQCEHRAGVSQRSDTTLGDTPAASASVAAVCRRSLESDPRQPSRLKNRPEMLSETIDIHRMARHSFEDQVNAF